eukprot:gb/GECG01007378.1/.p1 GENE.gb/GECG01007378.1/~~gb/GECG01007378.1/.p1  ORF type:complete len:113 (+),score=16.28 gb/GECG01007378.1/:1-339(+)
MSENGFKPSRLGLVLFEEFSQRSYRKGSPNKQPVAASFGHVSGTVRVLMTAGALLKRVADRKKYEEKENGEDVPEGNEKLLSQDTQREKSAGQLCVDIINPVNTQIRNRAPE